MKKMKELEKIGNVLSKEDLKNLFGGGPDDLPSDYYHGSCGNGIMFTFKNSANPSWDEDYISRHYCQGSGIAYVENRLDLL